MSRAAHRGAPSDGPRSAPRNRGSSPALRLGLAFLAAVLTELFNLGLGLFTAIPTLEPLPVLAFTSGVLLGWPGLAGCLVGQVLFRFALHGPFQSLDGLQISTEQLVFQCLAIPIAYALIGAAGYLVFLVGPDLGRGFPNPRSYVGLVLAALGGGMLTAAFLSFLMGPSLKVFLISTATSFVSVLLVCPPALVLADRYLGRYLAKIPGEVRPALPFPANLELEPALPLVDTAPSKMLLSRLAATAAAIVLLTLVVVPMAQQVPKVGGWPLLGYMAPVVWAAMTFGMRGALLATSLAGILYLTGRSFLDRNLLPDDPDLYAVGLYADFVVFSLVGVFLGAEREEESRLRIELESRARQMTLLNEMGDLLQACADAPEAFEVARRGVGQLFPNDPGFLAVRQKGSSHLEVVLVWGSPAPIERGELEAEDCWAFRRGQVHEVEDPRQGLLCRHSTAAPGSYLCVPLTAQGETLGMLHLASRHGFIEPAPPDVSSSRRELAVAVAKQISLALGNLKLREGLRDQSIRDPLTGLFNRRYLTESLARERSRAQRQKTTFGLIMIDIDHFKRFNDSYGHEAGDVVLRELGHFLLHRARREDIVCRYGGEEFVVVLSEASLEVTEERAENLRSEVRQLPIRHSGQNLGGITFSLGVAAYPRHGTTEEEILRAADAALYRAKERGRNRVEVAAEAATADLPTGSP